jgi:3-hydroxybutyryl-CoA dehydrogenase
MNILIKGEKTQTDELKLKLSSIESVYLTTIKNSDLPLMQLDTFDVIFDLSFDTHIEHLKYYANLNQKPVFVGAVKTQLAYAVFNYGKPISCYLFGLNTLPTFINRSLAEVSLLNHPDEAILMQTMKQLNWEYKLVEDRVGMVTPRIIFMIINEACYTLQEGTATMQDIDTSMKLGTNYPFGPFEWADKIGIKHVYETLVALNEDTKDERYKICPLLKTNYLKKGTFLY